jgi:SlyX protein
MVTAEIDEVKTILNEVQTQLAFQEDTVQALNEAMASQQRDILTLRRQLALLKQRLEEQTMAQETGAADGIMDEKPPHY